MSYNVLIVDDSSVVRSVIGKTMTLSDIPVSETFYAENGQEALNVLAKERIDIVFADINMPVMSGVEMVDRMVKNGMIDTVPVIIVSTEGSTTRIEQLMKKGVKGYVRKPFTPEKVRTIFKEILGDFDEE